MKKLNLSGFDLGVIIAFVVITLLGGGAWYYFSGALADAQKDDSTAKASFDNYSKIAKFNVVVSKSNLTTMETNTDVIKTQLLPIIKARFLSKDNKLSSIGKEDPVAWKHDLDDEVHHLNAAAKSRNIGVPANFYFGFSRYLSASPSDVQTAVLSKQLLGIKEITNILISSQIKDITAMRRTYEEDPHVSSNEPAGSEDRLPGYSTSGPNGAYVDYPFEVDFDTTSENLRSVLSGLVQSPYIFVVRSITVKNSNPNSPLTSALDQMAGPSPGSVTETSPGEVAATTSTKGPQYLYGSETLSVKARIDLIDWTSDLSVFSDAPAASSGKNSPGTKGGP